MTRKHLAGVSGGVPQRTGRSGRANLLPILALGRVASEWRLWRQEVRKPRFRFVGWASSTSSNRGGELPIYPIDMEPLLLLPHGRLDAWGVPINTVHGIPGGVYQPTSIGQYGLAHWNSYLRTRSPQHRDAFLVQARWLLAHEQRLASGAGVWPLVVPAPAYGTAGPWLSALTQGNVISVLVRAYALTGDDAYLDCARRAAHAFTLDILDGGVSAPVGADGIFFEEVATYPAARILNGYLLALFGLYDFVWATGDEAISALAARSVATLHALIDEYDVGYWTCYDLLHRRLATRFYHALHVSLIEALADYTGCAHCRALAARWAGYDRSRLCRLRYYGASRRQRYAAALARRVSARRTPAAAPQGQQPPRRVVVPITAFPVPGGMRAVLAGVAQVMAGEWQLDYLTRRVGTDTQGLDIQAFETRRRWLGPETSSPLGFPNVMFYMAAGRRALARLLRQRPYDLVLPQDGAFTAAFSGPVARKVGVPLVVMDHGTVESQSSAFYRGQRLGESAAQPLPMRLVSRLRVRLYLAALGPIIRKGVRGAARFLVAGDEVEAAYREHFGVPLSRIVRYPYRVPAELPASAETRASARRVARERLGIPAHSVVVALINRLTPEKGLDCALAALAAARSLVVPDTAASLRALVVGHGPLAGMVHAESQRLGLGDVCTLWGEAAPEEVTHLLQASDIFLYTGRRGTNYSMAVLEAMAAGCAVVATTEPLSNARLLADGRGFAVDVDDVGAIARAIAALLADAELRARTGALAQRYVALEHSAEALRRALRRATGWAPVLAGLTTESITRDTVRGEDDGEGEDEVVPCEPPVRVGREE